MSYENALEAAGAEVELFKSFGSYQGEWWALVKYDGERGWVNGSYGSCSGCDAFEAEFGCYSDGERCDEHEYSYDAPASCEACEAAATAYKERLASFGRGYLDGLLGQEAAINSASQYIEWDSEAQEMVDWLTANTIGSAQ